MTPLHLACQYDHREVVSLLLAAGANHEAQDKVSFLV
jgi:ankyrin repeat protein